MHKVMAEKKQHNKILKNLKKHFKVDEDEMAEEEYRNEDKASPPATFVPRGNKKYDQEEEDDEDSDEDDNDPYDGDVMDNEDEIEEGGRDYLENRSNNNMRSYPEDKDDILEDEGIVKPNKAQRKKMSAVEIAKRITRKTNM